MFNPKYLSYKEIRAQETSPLFRSFNLPLETAISWPMPTLRYKGPSFAYFASQKISAPNQPTGQGAPAYWWLLDARTGQLKLYTPCELLPFASDARWEPIHFKVGLYTREEVQAGRASILSFIDQAALDFFTGKPGDSELRQKLDAAIRITFPVELLDQYKALAPDFFNWLIA